MTELSDEHCWILLNEHSFGRVGVSVDGQPEIFPVDYYADGTGIIFRTADGTKKTALLNGGSAVFEIDARTEDGAWSVTAKGTAAVMPDEDVSRAAQDALPSWIPTAVFIYVRITPTELHGRRFERRLRPETRSREDAMTDERDQTVAD